jgi:hypothetical protein
MEPIQSDDNGGNSPFNLALMDPAIAYVKAVTVRGVRAWAIYASDGTELAVVPTRDGAVAMVVQHDMRPVSVH